MSATRVPLNFFGIGFGLAGLGEAWGFAAGQGLAPRWVSDAILALSAGAWLAGISLYLRYAATTRGVFGADLRDNVAGPFASLAVITPMLLAAAGIAPHAATAGLVLVDIFLVLTILAAEPYQKGRAGTMMEAGEVLTAAGLAGAVLAGRSRAAAALSGAALMAASALTRFGVFEAGRASARDPKYTVGPQRQRLREHSEPTT